MNNSDTSSSSQAQQQISRAPKRRRRRSWLYIVVLLVLLLAVVGYALLPWLIPTDWLRSQIVAGIQEQLGRSASVSAIEISWAEGIIIRDITIDRLERFGEGFFLKAARVQLDFRPLRLLLQGGLGRVRVDQPQFWIVTDAAGELNLASLGPLDAEEFEQISITNTNLYFVDQSHGRETQLAIAHIDVTREPGNSQYSVLALGAPSKSSGQASFELHGSYELVSGQLTIGELSGVMEGLEFTSSLQGRFLGAEGTFVPRAASLAVTVELGRVREQFPFLDELLSKHDLTITGSSKLAMEFTQNDAGIDHLSFSIDASDNGLHLPDMLHKSAGELCEIELSTVIDHSGGRLSLDQLQISCKLGQATLSLTDASCAVQLSPRGWPELAGSLRSAGQFRLENSASLARAIPPLQQFGVGGELAGRFDLGFDPLASLSLDLDLDASYLAWRLAEDPDKADADGPEPAVLFQKSLLTPAKLTLELQMDMSANNQQWMKLLSLLKLTPLNAGGPALHVKLGWQLGETIGSLEIEQRQGPSVWAEDGYHVDLTLSKIDLDSLDENFPFLLAFFERYQLAGSASVKLAARLSRELLLESMDFAGDFNEAQWVIPATTGESTRQTSPPIMLKPAQMPLTVRARLSAEDYDEQGYRRVKLESAQLSFAGSELNLAGSSIFEATGGEPFEGNGHWGASIFLERFLRFDRFVSGQFNADGRVVFNEELSILFPALELLHRRIELSGVLNHQLELTAEPDHVALKAKLSSPPEALKVGPAEFVKAEHHLQLFFKPTTEGLEVSGASLELGVLELSLFDEPLRLSGELSLSEDRLEIPDLFISVGDSSAYFTASLANISSVPSGYVKFHSPLIDQPALMDWLDKVSSFVQVQMRPGQSLASNHQALSPSDESPANPQPARLTKLPPMDISFQGKCDELLLSLPDGSAKFNLQQMNFDFQLTSASLTGQFSTAVNGGRFGGELSIQFDEPGVPVSYSYEALELMVEENLAPMISQVFPDMTVEGTISESRSVTTHIRGGNDLPAFGQEQGITILREGILVGPSAPGWVVYWFPTLSLTEYPFEVAHNVFSKDPNDGRMINDMVMIGKGRYNVYINGVSMDDNTTNYTLGVDMSPAFVSLEQRHTWRQSRVPLLTYTGKIVDHKWARQTVNFTWPTRAAWDMFVKNNALKTLIEQWRKAE